MAKLMKLLMIISLATLGFQAGATETDQTSPKRMVLQPKAATVTPRADPSTQLAAPAGVAKSAACCLKKCAEGGTCGQNCTVADSLSACGAVNFKFECPSDKGLSCLGSSCSCE